MSERIIVSTSNQDNVDPNAWAEWVTNWAILNDAVGWLKTSPTVAANYRQDYGCRDYATLPLNPAVENNGPGFEGIEMAEVYLSQCQDTSKVRIYDSSDDDSLERLLPVTINWSTNRSNLNFPQIKYESENDTESFYHQPEIIGHMANCARQLVEHYAVEKYDRKARRLTNETWPEYDKQLALIAADHP